ncbi:GntR family transcriptional regulator [Mesorhizobium sp. M2E.F.Ca.ET.209.01.1.1]|uniref:GntR family transcriptional regulator n=1 Tax=Mesorhizobium sp. M2E.F.Ca.ET.209.01.1.1 TaxID=2500526 RepID=UPI000FD974A9|nr:GntR family transcriptional regulator [Mesorhizobium sp. M2E.F.Ca.ET.209.01.1.1]TGS14490.1 GntR family transcriptional regulator [Mesorhizobium sp. M2E.F.Ca.ET.209.01.1.1]
MFAASKKGKEALPGDLAPIGRHSSLGESAYAALKDSLIRGALQPGTKLTLRSVAQVLEVSTTPARDAITRLIGEGGLINAGPKTVIVPYLSLPDLDEITAIRLSLEGLAAEQSTNHVTEADIHELEELQQRINRGLDEGRYTDVLDANKDFHFLIYRRSGMRRLVTIIESLWLRMGPAFNGLYPEFAQSRTGVSNHLWALRGLQDRDPAAVRAAIENDIRSGYRRLSSQLGAAGDQQGELVT